MPVPDAPLEEHAFGFRQREDGIERVFYRVDEAGGALRLAVAGDSEFDLLGLRIPVPVAGVGVGLDAVAAYVEPDGRVEGGVLADEDVDEFVVEGCSVFGSFEIALGQSPVADGFGDAGDELADSGFALGRADLAVQVFRGHDVGRGHGPVFGDFDVFLFEDHVALGVGDLGEAEIPFEFVVGRDAGLGEEAAEGETGGGLLISGGGGDGNGSGRLVSGK